MAFAVICKSCQARFLLNDDLLRRKVAGRVVTVRCRQCHAPIEVDASEVTPQHGASSTQLEPPGPPPPPPLKAALTYKPAPAPPRPAKSSTLIGIGSPPRPGAAPEMVALSPGLLDVPAPAPQASLGFPEPPPPPSSVEELSGDWEIPQTETKTKTPLMATVESPPESVDDFVEELPPSLPPPAPTPADQDDDEDDIPTSIGTPALSELTHHAGLTSKAAPVDFFVDMSAPALPDTGAPTIDVSSFDGPRTGKQTLPLFGLGEDTPATLSPPPVELLASPPRPPSAPQRATSDAGAPSQRPDSTRSRRNVVAPPTSSVPPPAPGARRSVLAVPVLLLLAAAAGFLIWKRSNAAGDRVAMVGAEIQPSATAVAPAAAAPAIAAEPAAVAVASTATSPEGHTTSDPAPPRASAKTEKVSNPSSEPKVRATPSLPSSDEPAASPKTEAPVEPSKPGSKEEPKPAEPSEPAGPFDRAAASAALTSAAQAASTCRKDGDPSGTASVVITFAPSGRVTSANIGGPPFAGTPTGGCIAAALRKAKVPPFEGDRVTVSKTIVVQ